MKLAIVLATLPVVAAAALSMPAQAPQGLGERVPVPVQNSMEPVLTPCAAACGELAVRLVDQKGKTLRSSEIELERLDDGWSSAWPITPRLESDHFVISELLPGRYKIEAMNEWPAATAAFFATGYADVEPQKRTSLTLSHVPDHPCTLSGRITLRGAAMADATVRASLQVWPQPLGASSEVDADGRFTLTLPRAGDWELHVESPGWSLGERAWGEVGSQPFPVSVPLTGLTDVVVAVSDARLSGVVRSLDGAPVPQLIVCVRSDIGEHGKWCRAYTDDEGRYEFRELPLGEWVVYVDPRQAHENKKAPPAGAIAWTRVALTTTDQRAVDVDLQLQPGTSLEWELVAADSRAVEWAAVMVRPAEAPHFFWFDAGNTGIEGWATDHGRMVRSRNLPLGSHEFSIQLPSDRLATGIGSHVSVTPTGQSTATILLVPTAVVRIRALDARGVPAVVRLVDVVPSGGRALLVRAPATFYSPLIRLEVVPAGEYQVRIADPAGRLYEQTITLNGEPERDVLFQL